MKKFTALSVLFLANFVHADTVCNLTQSQINKIVYIYNHSKKFKAKDGMTFNEAVSTIFLLETSLKKHNWLGDIHHKDKISYLVSGSFGPGQIRLATVLKLLHKIPYLQNKYGYLYHKNPYIYQKYNIYFRKMKYYYRILNSNIWKKRWKSGKKLAVKKWAEKEFKYWGNKYKKYVDYENKDLRIIKKLKDDLEFSVDIATNFLIYNYKKAKQKNLTFPYYRAISAYNGGWENENYLKRFFKYRKYVQCIENLYNLK